MTEIFRAGIQSVGHGQGEAADALGMTYGQKMRRVVLPQAFRVIIPPTGNEFIAMMKDTALVTFLGPRSPAGDLPPGAAGRQGRLQEPRGAHRGGARVLGPDRVFTFFQARLERRLEQGLRPGTRGASPWQGQHERHG